MNVDAFLTVRPAPRAVFDRLPTHRDRVRFHVRRTPEQGGGWEPVTWGQFATQIRGVARWLVERGVAVGDHVAIYAPNSVAWASAALGIQTAGAVVVPIYPASTAEQVAYILNHCEATHVFVAGNEQIERLGRAQTAARRVLLRGCAWSATTVASTIDDVGEFRAAAMRDTVEPVRRRRAAR